MGALEFTTAAASAEAASQSNIGLINSRMAVKLGIHGVSLASWSSGGRCLLEIGDGTTGGRKCYINLFGGSSLLIECDWYVGASANHRYQFSVDRTLFDIAEWYVFYAHIDALNNAGLAGIGLAGGSSFLESVAGFPGFSENINAASGYGRVKIGEGFTSTQVGAIGIFDGPAVYNAILTGATAQLAAPDLEAANLLSCVTWEAGAGVDEVNQIAGAEDFVLDGSGIVWSSESIWEGAGGGGTPTDYSLTADPATGGTTAGDASLRVSRGLDASPTSSGSDATNATLRLGKKVSASPTTAGSTGQAASLRLGRSLPAAGATAGSTGQAASLRLGRSLPAAGATAGSTGQGVNLRWNRSLQASGATAGSTGQTAALKIGWVVEADPTSSGSTFSDASLAVGAVQHTLTAESATSGSTVATATLRVNRAIAADAATGGTSAGDASLRFITEMPAAGATSGGAWGDVSFALDRRLQAVSATSGSTWSDATLSDTQDDSDEYVGKYGVEHSGALANVLVTLSQGFSSTHAGARSDMTQAGR